MTCVVPATIISRIPELKHNPFRFRICEVFGHRIASGVESNAKTYKIDAKKPNPATIKAIKDKYYVEIEEWYFNFPNFVTMMNAFSPRSTAPVKAYYAFLLYDYNGDKFIDTEDITYVQKQILHFVMAVCMDVAINHCHDTIRRYCSIAFLIYIYSSIATCRMYL